MTILDKLAAHAKERTEIAKSKISLEEMKNAALSLPKGDFKFENALRSPDISFICECKKASPSKGLIAPDFPYLEIATEYESAGADCISVLTEPKWFLGSDKYLKEIANKVTIPCLRKDFTVDEYMIYEAKTLGASAVLLMCSIPLEEDMILFETGTFTTFAPEPVFEISLVRQFPNDDEEFYQIHVNILYKTTSENKIFSEATWDEDLSGNIFDYIRKSEVFAYAKNKEYIKVEIYLDET